MCDSTVVTVGSVRLASIAPASIALYKYWPTAARASRVLHFTCIALHHYCLPAARAAPHCATPCSRPAPACLPGSYCTAARTASLTRGRQLGRICGGCGVRVSGGGG